MKNRNFLYGKYAASQSQYVRYAIFNHTAILVLKPKFSSDISDISIYLVISNN